MFLCTQRGQEIPFISFVCIKDLFPWETFLECLPCIRGGNPFVYRMETLPRASENVWIDSIICYGFQLYIVDEGFFYLFIFVNNILSQLRV